MIKSIFFYRKKLKCKSQDQSTMLADGLTDLLFKMSGGGDAVFCLLGETNCFEPPSSYTNDNFTEKVNIIS